mmetsp:Transcript_70436/g.199740  ORF Transcript_70436/g.199740 Transcript_70436/m.199740 type:complete len:245 (+) Transcript_70436:1280-2014(+)
MTMAQESVFRRPKMPLIISFISRKMDTRMTRISRPMRRNRTIRRIISVAGLNLSFIARLKVMTKSTMPSVTMPMSNIFHIASRPRQCWRRPCRQTLRHCSAKKMHVKMNSMTCWAFHPSTVLPANQPMKKALAMITKLITMSITLSNLLSSGSQSWMSTMLSAERMSIFASSWKTSFRTSSTRMMTSGLHPGMTAFTSSALISSVNLKRGISSGRAVIVLENGTRFLGTQAPSFMKRSLTRGTW